MLHKEVLESLPPTCRTKPPLLTGTGRVVLSLPLAKSSTQVGQDPEQFNKSRDKVEPRWQAACRQAHAPPYQGAPRRKRCASDGSGTVGTGDGSASAGLLLGHRQTQMI